MKREKEFQDVSNRAKLDLSEVVWYRLGSFFTAEEEEDSLKQESHQPEESPPEPALFEEANRICQGSEEAAAADQPSESKPIHESPVTQEDDDIMEGFWKSEVRSIKSSVEKLKRSQKTLNAICVALVFLCAISLALIGRNYSGAKSPQALSHGGVGEAKELIRGQNAPAQALVRKRDGVFGFELRDGAEKAQASISVAPGDDLKLSLYNKDHKKLGEWGGEEVKAPVVESNDKTVAPPSVSEGASAPEGVVPSAKYVGSKTSDKYHYPHCKWVELIRPERLLTFSSVKEAKDNGNHVRCPTCKPPLADSPVTAENVAD